jgi:hypothetical protein
MFIRVFHSTALEPSVRAACGPPLGILLSRGKGVRPAETFLGLPAYLQWNCVTSTDPNLFQSPFRAGIQIDAYQLEPLQKALRLPRVNLFIADDVGLGETIEAGLIARELPLRKKARTSWCPVRPRCCCNGMKSSRTGSAWSSRSSTRSTSPGSGRREAKGSTRGPHTPGSWSLTDC